MLCELISGAVDSANVMSVRRSFPNPRPSHEFVCHVEIRFACVSSIPFIRGGNLDQNMCLLDESVFIQQLQTLAVLSDGNLDI